MKTNYCNVLWLLNKAQQNHVNIIWDIMWIMIIISRLLVLYHIQFSLPTQIASFMGPTWGPSRPVGPRWAPCWPLEPCYQGNPTYTLVALMCVLLCILCYYLLLPFNALWWDVTGNAGKFVAQITTCHMFCVEMAEIYDIFFAIQTCVLLCIYRIICGTASHRGHVARRNWECWARWHNVCFQMFDGHEALYMTNIFLSHTPIIINVD